ncbi:hypothetical protein [Prevotella sp. kh1p2]|uniref:hypothetical protein n=1 Tax=Prevotella sp. kh1p2 TaxID=1761883 RepID=UPI0008CF6B89|nr:hypothetical protein [Prevotella sp. kh1p2]SES96883.1 hypothetical protein SAMN04487825_109116 [Prevotella sp. kh1p2]SNU11360.1 hypothetical protein SAMN06298210_109115 [Prevotellaceae bacterium KH2P17]
MSQPTIIAIVIVLACFAVAIFAYLHRKHISYNLEDLQKSIATLFGSDDSLPRSKFLMGLKNKYSCSQKDALYLMGQAREHGLIVVEDDKVRPAR